ncbi:MAG: acyltransferase, partial [Micromonosporaceae bacterium]|nr:acyltransferase [Micromonosporaceae bacterium]
MVLEQAARPVVVAEAVPPEEGRFRTDIEGLRAVAILLVVLYHIGLPIIGGGYVGVDVFFVISGFLITTQLYRELDRTGTISIVGFYAKRIARLLPAATLTIAVTVAAAWFWMPPTRFHSIAIDGVCAALYGINYRLASAGIVYLGASEPPSPLQNFWSLAVEEQFYVVWPLLLLTAATWWRRRRGRVPGRRVLVVPLVVLAVASFALSVAQTVSAAPWAFFGAPARAWELATGAVIALVVPRLERIGRWLAWGLQAAGIVVIVAAGVLYRDTMAFPGYLATVPVLGAAAVIIAGCQRRHWTPVGWLLARPAMQRIGKLSYSWYLWHWPVLIVVPIAVGLPPNLGWNLLLAVWSLALAAVCNALVEDPVRFSRVLRRRPWRSVRLGLVLSATVAVAAGAAIIWLPLRTIPVDTSGRPVDNLAEMVAQPTFGERDLARIIQASTQIKAIPQNLSPRLDLAPRDFPVMYTDGCDPPLTSSAIQDKCVYGDP